VLSRENAVVAAAVVAAVGLFLLVTTLTDWPTWAAWGVLFTVGVLVPLLVNEAFGPNEDPPST
jgi:uncharacterized membrane protein YraQ (UPF0718 family)